MATQRKKKLTQSEIAKLSSALEQKKLIQILGKYDVTIDTFWKETDVTKVAMQYIALFQQLSKEKDITNETVVNFIDLAATLMTKQFSDVWVPEIDNIHDLIDAQKALINTNILKQVIDAFPTEEKKKVMDKIQLMGQRVGEILGEAAVKSSLTNNKGVEDGNNEPETTGSGN